MYWVYFFYISIPIWDGVSETSLNQGSTNHETTDSLYFINYLIPELCVYLYWILLYFIRCTYGVASISTLLKVIGLFCKIALQKRLYSTNETHNFKEPTNRSHPMASAGRNYWFTLLHELLNPWVMYLSVLNTFILHELYISSVGHSDSRLHTLWQTHYWNLFVFFINHLIQSLSIQTLNIFLFVAPFLKTNKILNHWITLLYELFYVVHTCWGWCFQGPQMACYCTF